MQWIEFIQIIAVPLFGAVAYLAWNATRKAQDAHDELAAFRLHVAQTYASVGYLKDVEARLVTTLDKIDAKLERALLRNNNENHQ